MLMHLLLAKLVVILLLVSSELLLPLLGDPLSIRRLLRHFGLGLRP